MELIWKAPDGDAADGFDNASSPYVHYWLEDHMDGHGPACGHHPARAGLIEVASALPMDVADLVDRAFKR